MRLIVLSKTHAWGRFGSSRTKEPERAHTCALFYDVFSSRPFKLQGKPGKPFNSQCHSPTRSKPDRKPCFLTIAKPLLVEPDGIEPTTSCLQSTRSTN